MSEGLHRLSVADRADELAVLDRVGAEVLETMFFSEAVVTPCGHAWLERATSVRVVFAGSHFGEIFLSVSMEAERSIASGFLGLNEEETTGSQGGQVISELANIFCGAVMSSLWPESSLNLDSPELTGSPRHEAGAMHRCFILPEGMLAVSIHLSDGPVVPRNQPGDRETT
jgi:hypothetical protein